MKLLDKLERKYGRYAITGFMRYIVILYIIGLAIGVLFPGLSEYESFMLDFDKIARGQVWRLVTYLIPITSMNGIFWSAISVYIYYIFGISLENAWGAFRLNMYFLVGILLNLVVSFGMYLLGQPYVPISNIGIICQTLFFVFAAIYPNSPIYLYFLIPLKAKYLAFFFGALYIYDIIADLIGNRVWAVIPNITALVTFLLFFLASRNYHRLSPGELHRKAAYRRQVNKAKSEGNVVQFQGRNVITRHKCAVCGRTELDNENLEFRFCSKCDGNYEYCMDHLFTHEHVHQERSPKDED